MKEETLKAEFQVYKNGFIDGFLGDTNDYGGVGREAEHNSYVQRAEYLVGEHDGFEASRKHLNFTRWKEDYVRRQKK